jgi:hypothetical protein
MDVALAALVRDGEADPDTLAHRTWKPEQLV